MKKNPFKKPPFALDRSRRGDLARQIADGLRTAIETGYYGAGDIVPSARDLATLLGVSKGIAEQAVATIREAGLINPRPCVGSVVCPKDRPPWKGTVLVVVPPGIGDPRANMVSYILREALTKAGYLPLSVSVPEPAPDGKSDFAILDTMLHQQIDLVVQIDYRPGLSRWLSKCGVPFARLTREQEIPGSCVGQVRIDDEPAYTEFAAHCREAGVSEVTLVSAWDVRQATAALEATGVRVRSWRAAPGRTKTAIALSQWAVDAFSRCLAKKGAKRPELVFFDDDHLATGALFAMDAAGIRIPEDLRVATIANRDYGPIYFKPLARVEEDNAAFGARLAECVLAYLGTGAFPKGVVVGPKYERGETL